jgi:hypothetical protein
MKLLSHFNPADAALVKDLDDRFPFPFLKGYASFIRRYYGGTLHLLYSPEFEAWLPLRIIRAKLATLGQVFHAPMRRFEELVPKDQLIFFNMMLRFLRKTNLCDRLIQPFPFVVLGALPPNVKSCEFGTYVSDLEKPIETLLGQFNGKYQKAVRHSARHGARVVASWDVFRDFYGIYLHTMDRVGMPAESELYFSLLRECLGDNHTLPAVVYDGDQPVGSAFFVYTLYAAYCTHAGSIDGSRLYGSMKMLHYEMMRILQARGVHRYDLVGVRLKNTDPALEGVFRFKKGFGGDLRSGYLWKTDLNPLRCRLYDAALGLRMGGKHQKDIIDQSN